jgi:tRNA(adenine34) deaminase
MDDIYWMKKALVLAKKAEQKGEVPVGAILVLDNKIIGKGYNCPISTNDPTAHAEIIVLRKASKKLENYRLLNTTLYVTLEPCSMCMGAMVHARIKRLVFGAHDAKLGRVNHKIELTGDVLANDSSELLKQFFRERRQ